MIVLRFNRAFVFATLVLWLLGLAHCQMECASPLSACCGKASASPDRATAKACLCEKSSGSDTARVQAPLWLPALTPRDLVAELLIPDGQSGGMLLERLDQVPPELAKRWQFISRSASSPRSPSFAS